MPPRVFGQVVAAHEAPVAHVANKLLLAGVRPAVAGKLVGAGKFLVAALPVTAERLFTCSRAEVGLLEHKELHKTIITFPCLS